MCSPEPGKGGGRGGRGGGGRRHHGGGGGGGSSGGGGLLEFWSCLDPKQRDSLLTINGRAVRDALDCDLCRDLVSSATFALEEGGVPVVSGGGIAMLCGLGGLFPTVGQSDGGSGGG